MEPRFRMPSLEIPALRKLAKDKPCMFRVEGVCNNDPATTVWCHSNQGKHGKGMGAKSHDPFGAFGCSSCHDWYDNKIPNVPHEEKVATFERARDATTYFIWANNLVRVNKEAA